MRFRRPFVYIYPQAIQTRDRAQHGAAIAFPNTNQDMRSSSAQADAIAAMYQPPATGRPSDIGDPHLLQQLFAAIEDGNYLETACHLVGLSHVTVYNWKRRGEAGEEPYTRFVTAYKAAEARAEAKMLANVRKASELPQFWAAGMTVLERRHPDRWGKRQDDSTTPKVVVNIGVGGNDVRVGILSPSVSPDIHSLSASNSSELSPISGHYVNQSTSVPGELERQIPAVESGGGPYPLGGGGQSPVGGGARQRARRGAGKGKKG